MKDLKHLEQELGELLGKYMSAEQSDFRTDDYPNEHEFYKILENCEELIKAINSQ
jgi:hypothetical protein